ncbi:MAG: hypothetical protein TE42_00040 [Candidatus Synechococcus spongiarum SP3]|uniref:DNA methylase N-4/N-6 domain-containing protein n=1 Tax=Candidatus Synechococcus spongiarum SP3 TaxID=1604020 RepID=A0A0G2IX64_9SYNE|nr:MAG: hypothetical protein TE42_00040 [Candidatus Synechococcus spongiarum SP3]
MLGSDFSGVHHPAVFPRELARRYTLLESQPGEGILDPLSRWGTTGVVAAQSSRRAVFVELNPAYAQQSRSRVSQDLQLTMIL